MLEIIEPVRRILDVENDGSEDLSRSIEGAAYPLWPQIRCQFATALTAIAFGSVEVPQTQDSGAFRRKLLRSLLPSRWDGARFTGERRLLYVMSGETTYVDNSRERNWLVDGFIDELPDRSVLMHWCDVPSANGAPAFRDTRTLGPMLSRGNISARLRSDRKAVFSSAHALVRRLAGHLGDDIDEATLSQIANREANRELARPRVEREFSRLLQRTKPEFLVLDNASYGSYASLISIARRQGVVVVEPQHGWIGASHPAYNFGAMMHQSEFAQLLPDVLLTFGEFWGTELRFPGRIVPIGKAHLDSLATRAAPVDARPRVVLVASSVRNPEQTDRFVIRLRQLLPSSWGIRFRPHPSERENLASRYPMLAAESGIVIDPERDLYRSLADVRIVVGSESTVLFEALKFDCTVFVRESATTPYYLGASVGEVVSDSAGPAQIARRIDDGDLTPPTVPVNAIWRPDARRNFTEWVENPSRVD